MHTYKISYENVQHAMYARTLMVVEPDLRMARVPSYVYAYTRIYMYINDDHDDYDYNY